MSQGSREALLKKRPVRTELVIVPEDFPDAELAGAEYTVKAMTARERTEWEKQFSDKKTGKTIKQRQDEIRARLIVATVIDATGGPLFADDDVPALMETDVGLVDLLVNAAFRLNSMKSADLDDLAKN